jgi:hypothetical protein
MDKLVAKVRPTAALRHPLAHTGENKRRLGEAAASQIRTRTIAKSTDYKRPLFHIGGHAASPFSGKAEDMNWTVRHCDGNAQAHGPLL